MNATAVSSLALVLTIPVTSAVFAQPADLHAIVGPKGNVVLCQSRGDILFADNCAGSGRLRIIQPIKPGRILWKSATGTVMLENPVSNPDCALSSAKWDSKAERSTDSGKQIHSVDPLAVLLQLSKNDYAAHLEEGDITAFELDLDNSGNSQIVFSASNVRRLIEMNAKGAQAQRYVVAAGILRKDVPYPLLFHFEQTDDPVRDFISDVTIEGVVPFVSGEIGIVANITSHVSDTGKLIRYRRGQLQRIETVTKTCD